MIKHLKNPFFVFFITSTSLIILLSSCYLHNGWWGIEMLSFFILPVVLLNFFLLLIFIKHCKLYSIFPLSVLLLSIKSFDESFAFNFRKDEGNSDFRIISYNIGLFNPDRMLTRESKQAIFLKEYQWIREYREPDILCLQEFYHSETKSGEQTLDSIAVAGNYKYYYINPHYDKLHDGFFGVATFSKFPAIKSGELQFGTSFINKGTWHDFLIKGDTIRILNFHLQSMSIRPQYNNGKNILENFYDNTINIYLKLKFGFEKRKKELKIIEAFIAKSPYKIIICADLNALPYSYTYQRLKKRFNNGFENAGTGFGFTYHRFPWFIRIDNQFYDKRLKIKYFKTLKRLKNSDHYPIEAGYSIN